MSAGAEHAQPHHRDLSAVRRTRFTLAGIAGIVFVVGVALLPQPHGGVNAGTCHGNVTIPLDACSSRSLAVIARSDAAAVAADVLGTYAYQAAVSTLPALLVRPVSESCKYESGSDGQADYSCLVVVADAKKHGDRAFTDQVTCDIEPSLKVVPADDCFPGAADSREKPVPIATSTNTTGVASTPATNP